jgi:hypothetical protein
MIIGIIKPLWLSKTVGIARRSQKLIIHEEPNKTTPALANTTSSSLKILIIPPNVVQMHCIPHNNFRRIFLLDPTLLGSRKRSANVTALTHPTVEAG